MKQWHIKYNGWLRNDETGNLEAVRFGFFWRCLSDPIDFSKDLHPEIVASSIANASWRNGFFNKLRSTHEERFEQWGQMTGPVYVNTEPPQVLYLRGMRDHGYGQRDWGGKYTRYVATMAHCDDGTFFHLGAVTVKGTDLRLNYGYVGTPRGAVLQMRQHSLRLPLLANEYCNIPERFTLSFEAGGTSYVAYVNVLSITPVYNGSKRLAKSNLCLTKVTVNGISGYGFTEFMYLNEDSFDGTTPVAKKHSVLRTIDIDDLTYFERTASVVPLSSRAARCQGLCGGKSANLALMKDLANPKIRVPSGICITTNAYDAMIEANPNIRTESTAEQIRSQILASRVPEGVQHNLKDRLDEVFPNWADLAFAVRSSAVGEDSEGSSSAGQMETILNVSGFDNICKAVIECWASQFREEAASYSRQHGASLQKPAVLVQEMVQPTVSGVLFTCNPLDSDRTKISINACGGLGEAVVSGEIEPDEITVNRSGNDVLSIAKVTVGAKQSSDDSSASTCCLTESEIMHLAEIGLEIEQLFGDPRDIEWAVRHGLPYILQARPITTFNAEDELERSHEFDTPIRSDNDYLTTANVSEVMGGSLSPLGISVVCSTFDKAMQISTSNWSEFEPMIKASFPSVIFKNHCLLNMNQLFYRRKLDRKQRGLIELGVLGMPRSDEDLDRQLQQLPQTLKPLTGIIKLFRNVEPLAKEAVEILGNERSFGPDCANNSEAIFDEILQECRNYAKVGYYHLVVSSRSSISYSLIGPAVLSSGSGEFDEQFFADIAKIYATCDNVISADVPHDLQRIITAILLSEKAKDFADMEPKAALTWLTSEQAGDAGQAFTQFMQRHGHRCIHEIDFFEDSWSENPESFVAYLQGGVRGGAGVKMKKAKDAISVDDIVDSLRISYWSRRFLRYIIPKARAWVGERELAKSRMIRMRDILRKGFKRLASTLVAEGRLPDASLIFYMTLYEIRNLIAGRGLEATDRARMRKRLRPVVEEVDLPEVCRGYPTEVQESASAPEDGETIKGTPVCLGRVTAPVRVAKNLDAAKDIQPGDILVARTTDIAWSVYFPLLAGVVTEAGGLLSHGAVVAREYGLPCLVAAKGACNFFKSGEIATLDANRGTISKSS